MQTLSQLVNYLQEQTPSAVSLTSLGLYSLICLTFVFAAMMEYAVILLAIRRANMLKAFVDEPKPKYEGKWSMEEFHREERLWKDRVKRGKEAEKKKNQFCYNFDRMSLLIFSTAFIIFNIVYFST